MKKISLVFVILICFFTIGFAYDIVDFSDYVKKVETIKDVTPQKYLTRFLNIKDKKCSWYMQNDNYVISPICLLKNDLPSVDAKYAIDKLRPSVIMFEKVYDDVNTSFVYEGANVILNRNFPILLPYNLNQKYILAAMEEKAQKIRIPEINIIYNAFKDFTFYVTKKDLSILRPCTRQNYTVAFNSMDNIILQSGEVFNLNDHIAYLDGYCKGTGPKNLMFYGGVCGLATQLFRTTLLMPNIIITQRFPHSMRIVPYYSEYVFGDDAALYELGKQLEIKNIGNTAIYFKTWEKSNKDFDYLVAISPAPKQQKVVINKTQVDNLKGEVSKQVYYLDNNQLINTEVFDSSYTKRFYETR